MSTSKELERWCNLLVWLKSHGMDDDVLLIERRQVPGTEYYGLYSKQTLPPKTILFTIPKSALMNIRTLAPSYYASGESPSLSATQLISLHLVLHRPPLDEQESKTLEPLFGPYISTLPRDFDYHPLSWMVKNSKNPSTAYKLDSILPPSVLQALDDMSSKFYGDLAAVCLFVRDHPEILEKATSEKTPGAVDFVENNMELVLDYLWAWLNVNTRCIHYQVKNSLADPDNITLCPILDFANHTLSQPTCIVPPASSSRSLRRDLSLLSPADTCVDVDSELFLTYGAHCNRVLFVEYGFVLPILSADELIPESQHVIEVNVDDVVKDLFKREGEAGSWMKEVLEFENYWGDWTIHAASGSAFPSYRLITALRLFSIVGSTTFSSLSKEESLRPWKDIILGRREELSKDLELSWRDVLRRICVTIVERASRALLDTVIRGDENLVILWKEERCVAECIVNLIESGSAVF